MAACADFITYSILTIIHRAQTRPSNAMAISTKCFDAATLALQSHLKCFAYFRDRKIHKQAEYVNWLVLTQSCSQTKLLTTQDSPLPLLHPLHHRFHPRHNNSLPNIPVPPPRNSNLPRPNKIPLPRLPAPLRNLHRLCKNRPSPPRLLPNPHRPGAASRRTTSCAGRCWDQHLVARRYCWNGGWYGWGVDE